ncbi:MAG TPA: hypothetical protein VGV12_10690 [Gemmatimonadales bacterium]|nr:hypothetical protein [Gemmatimonadales bacterium]
MQSRVVWAGIVPVAAAALLACNEGLHPITCSGICGTVTFAGAVPESTQAVYVVAYHTFPHSRDSLFNFQPSLSSLHALPLNGVPYFYDISVEPGRYEWVLAVWVKQGFNLTNADSTLREAGYYRSPADTSQPGVVTLGGAPASSINFVVDFGHMHPPCHYYNPPCP